MLIHPNRVMLEKRLLKHGKLNQGLMDRLEFIVRPLFYIILFVSGFLIKGLSEALAVSISRIKITSNKWPNLLDGYTILFISDLHFNKSDRLLNALASRIKSVDFDIAVLGGDYNFHHTVLDSKAKDLLARLVLFLSKRPVFAVLGNHDDTSAISFLEGLGVNVLLNTGKKIEKNGGSFFVSGIDDEYFFRSADVAASALGIPESCYKIMISHSPEPYEKIESAGYDLCLCGHTHGGQICLPGGVFLIKHSDAPRRMVTGLWKHGKLTGYTSRGAGTSFIPVRLFCPPEITMIEFYGNNS